jgi:hypothetical protein
LALRYRGIATTLVIGSLVARSVLGQSGLTSLTHVVSVTVQPRVKVLVGSVAPRAIASAPEPAKGFSAAGLSVSIDANRSWILVVATGAQDRTRSLQTWVGQLNDSSSVHRGVSTFVSESLGGSVVEASALVRRLDLPARSNISEKDKTVVLTMVAP